VEPEGRGDFISLVSRQGPEKVLADTIEKHWNKLPEDAEYRGAISSDPSKFKLRRFEIGLGAELPSVEELADHIQFLRSDHARFWYNNETDYQLSLRGLLFTDTGPYRGDMQSCYHRECDSKRRSFKGEFANYDFLAQTVQTVIDTVSELSNAVCEGSSRQQRMKRFAMVETSKWERRDTVEYVTEIHYIDATPTEEKDSIQQIVIEENHPTEAAALRIEEMKNRGAASSSTPSLPASPSSLFFLCSLPWLPSLSSLLPYYPFHYLPWMG